MPSALPRRSSRPGGGAGAGGAAGRVLGIYPERALRVVGLPGRTALTALRARGGLEGAADDDAVAVEADVVTAAVGIRSRWSAWRPRSKETSGTVLVRARSLLQRTHPAKQARRCEKSARQTFYYSHGATKRSACAGSSQRSQAPVNVNDRRAPAMDGVISSHVRVSRSAAGEFLRASRDQ